LAEATKPVPLTRRKFENAPFRRPIEEFAEMSPDPRVDVKLEHPQAGGGSPKVPDTVLFTFLKKEKSVILRNELAPGVPNGWRPFQNQT
jgi:hypothetical protein